MTLLSKSLKALAIILSLILSAGSALIALDAQNLSQGGINVTDQGSTTTETTVDLYLVINVKNTGYFFDIYDVNLTIVIVDQDGRIYDRDMKIIPKILVGGSQNIRLDVSIPIDVAISWQNGTIKLFAKLYFVFWFSKYDYKLMKFGIAAKTELTSGG